MEQLPVSKKSPTTVKTQTNKSKPWTVIPYRNKYLKFEDSFEIVKMFLEHLEIDGVQYPFDALNDWENYLDDFNEKEGVKVIHFYYEFAKLTVNNALSNFNAKSPIAILIRYKKRTEVDLNSSQKVELILNHQIKEENYLLQFAAVMQNLEDGNCYQVNLTDQFKFSFNDEVLPFDLVSTLFSKGKTGAYGHATFLPKGVASEFDQLLFSNSPECLFQMSKIKHSKFQFKISSMPIKGTLVYDESKDDFEKKWCELKESVKNQSELDMITDMIRNDLSSIEKPRSYVKNRKRPLIAPGILHQYSLVEVMLENRPRLSKIMRSMFPGASITGAPKKKVTEIIDQLENEPREFYCGSTYVSFQDFAAASINIRSFNADLSRKKLSYGAGGGVTLQSSGRDEYQEMLIKVKSFSDLLNLNCEF